MKAKNSSDEMMEKKGGMDVKALKLRMFQISNLKASSVVPCSPIAFPNQFILSLSRKISHWFS